MSSHGLFICHGRLLTACWVFEVKVWFYFSSIYWDTVVLMKHEPREERVREWSWVNMMWHVCVSWGMNTKAGSDRLSKGHDGYKHVQTAKPKLMQVCYQTTGAPMSKFQRYIFTMFTWWPFSSDVMLRVVSSNAVVKTIMSYTAFTCSLNNRKKNFQARKIHMNSTSSLENNKGSLKMLVHELPGCWCHTYYTNGHHFTIRSKK